MMFSALFVLFSLLSGAVAQFPGFVTGKGVKGNFNAQPGAGPNCVRGQACVCECVRARAAPGL
jgi:hypothetical protein